MSVVELEGATSAYCNLLGEGEKVKVAGKANGDRGSDWLDRTDA